MFFVVKKGSTLKPDLFSKHVGGTYGCMVRKRIRRHLEVLFGPDSGNPFDSSEGGLGSPLLPINTHTYMHTCMHTYIHACIHTCIHACMHTYMHAYIHAYIHACMHTYLHACIHTYMSHGQNTRRPLYQGGVRFCVTHAKTMENDKVSPKNDNP